MVKLKPITEKSWLVLSDDGIDRVGLLSEQKNKFILIVKSAKTVFNNKQEINAFFNEDIFLNLVEDQVTEESVEYFIKGYPVDFNHPFEADSNDKISHLPLYTKTEKSDVLYTAGYYCLNFPKGWMPAFCPKLSTLEKYKYTGPYKTEKEMKFILAKNRRCQK